jgi:hypothetical protein
MGAKKKREARQARDYKFTPAQELMRKDMEKMTTLPGMGLDDVFDKVDSQREYLETHNRDGSPYQSPVEKGDPEKLDAILDDVVGPQSRGYSRSITQIALDIISTHSELVLSLKQWQIVQELVEDGIRAGARRG